MSSPITAKAELRRRMRSMRRELPDQAERSERIWEHVRALPAVRSARVVMAYGSILGEPRSQPFVEWCRAEGKQVVLPEDHPPPDPRGVDVVIVPGVAFTADGHRLGQGGGWYDRFLPRRRPGVPAIGVAFAAQIVDALPREVHDAVLDLVVTEDGVLAPPTDPTPAHTSS